MKKNKLLIVMTMLVFIVSLTGCGLKEKIEEAQKTPLEIYKEATANTAQLSAVKMKINTETNGKVDGIENAKTVVTYELDKNKYYVEMESDNKVAALFIGDNHMYLKDGTMDKYVDLQNSNLGNMLLTGINFAKINPNYKTLSDEILNTVKAENVAIEDAELAINGKNEKVKKATVTVPQEEAKKILSKYMESLVKTLMGSFVEEMAKFQITTEESITGETISEEKRNQIKEKLNAEMNKQIQDQLNAMSFSDIKIVSYIKDGIIVKAEETYSITTNGETANIKTVREILEHGKNVKCPEIPQGNVITLDEYLNSQK